jgi:hypothetical protein
MREVTVKSKILTIFRPFVVPMLKMQYDYNIMYMPYTRV